MKPRSALLVTIIVLTGGIPAASVPATADGFVSVSASVTTSAPTPDDPFTVLASVSNADDSDQGYVVRELEIRTGPEPGADLISDRSLSVGVTPGETRSLPINATLNESGRQTVYLHVRLAGGQRIVQPVTVEVYEATPQLEITTEPAGAGEPRTMTVIVSNGLESAIRNVEVTVAGERVDLRTVRRIAAGVDPGANQRFEFTVTPEAESELPVEVTLRYSVGPERRTVIRTLSADFGSPARPAEHPQLALSVEEAVAGATRTVGVTVANGLDRAVRQVNVAVSSPRANFTVDQRVTAQLGAGQTVEFSFPATVSELGRYPVEVTLSYVDDGVQQRITRTFQASFRAPPNPGRVRLTGVDAVQTGRTLELSATASNVGSTPVEAVVIEIGGEELRAADYFVGGIEGSDFASFSLSTQVLGDRNLSSVPVEVTYVVGGATQTTTVSVPVDRQPVADPSRGGGGFPVLPAIVVVALVLVIGGVIYRRRG